MAERTWLFTDVEGSTRLLRELGDRYRVALAEHGYIVQNAAAAHGGTLHDTQGDSFFFSFPSAGDALMAAVVAQRQLDAHEWTDGHPLRVRMALHTGEGALEDGRPVGLGVHRAARLCPLGHGGQVLATEAVRAVAPEHAFKDLGARKLKDFDEPVRVHQLLSPGLHGEFPPLRPSEPPRRRWPFALAAVLAAVAGVLAYFVATGGGNPIKVTPNSVAVLDARTNKLTDDVPVGQDPSDVAYGSGAVWTTNAVDRTATHIDASTNAVVRASATHASEEHVAVGPGGIALLGGTPGIHADLGNNSLGEVVDQLGYASTITPPGPTRCVATTCWGTYDIAAGPLGVWAPGNRGTAVIDLMRRRAIRISTTQAEEARVAVGTRAVFITEGATGGDNGNDPGSVIAVTATMTVRRRSVMAPVDVCTDGPHAWVAETGGSLAEVDASGRLMRRLRLPGSPTAVAYGEGAVWVALARGDLLRIDPLSLRIKHTTHLVATPTAIAVGASKVWVSIA